MSLPSTVRKALAVRTGMVNREHVYMPSSVSVTSLRLMVSSAVVAWTSSIRLSRRAARKREREREREGEGEGERERREREREGYLFLLQFIQFEAPSRGITMGGCLNPD